MKVGYYCAEEVSGVYYWGEIIEDPEIDIMRPLDFLESLSSTQEPIYTYLDSSSEEIYDAIETQYGVREW